jgi:hypothetical protein
MLSWHHKHPHTYFSRTIFISFSRQIWGSEANKNNKRILRIFAMFLMLSRLDVDQVSENVAEISNK